MHCCAAQRRTVLSPIHLSCRHLISGSTSAGVYQQRRYASWRQLAARFSIYTYIRKKISLFIYYCRVHRKIRHCRVNRDAPRSLRLHLISFSILDNRPSILVLICSTSYHRVQERRIKQVAGVDILLRASHSPAVIVDERDPDVISPELDVTARTGHHHPAPSRDDMYCT
jgi:hypothetical protein